MRIIVSLLIAVLIAGCSTHIRRTEGVQLDANATWVLLPLVNRTATPQAGLRAAAITEAVLYQHGVKQVVSYTDNGDDGVLFEGSSAQSREKMQQWASKQSGRYLVSGVVHEWRYKTGVDGEPAVGVMIEVREMPSGKIVYSGTGARAGWARQSLSETGQRVIDKILAPVVD
ncbi:hypothetical protein A11A3_02007 [Alcanivorax hongdengensis A-11-3]|uniref:Lipoprotein n=1 Tax=Alcanivorax hongdengensis A-11-3 TaxID=1177179 RepID=L0WEZ6_9GAMM|nr:hypothetical protein [Alcanivorax hongdengensis]EKF75606.1 hypothetical protein A11A3_02007 [Alcanivorax hongdengensis A-11-3]